MKDLKVVTQHTHEHLGGNIYMFDVRDVIVADVRIDRKFPPTKSKIKEMADSLTVSKQLNPISVRLNEAGNPIVIAGHTRLAAMTLLNEAAGKYTHKIRAEVKDIGEKDAALEAIIDNDKRNDTSAVDKAFAHDALRKEPYNMSDAEIARHLSISSGMVSKLKKLLTLDHTVLKQVHEGAMTFSDAIIIADSTVEDQKRVAHVAETAKKKNDEKKAADAANKGGKAAPVKDEKSRKTGTSKEVKATIREVKAKEGKTAATKPAPAKSASGNAPAKVETTSSKPEKSKSISLTVAEIRGFFSALSQERDELEEIGKAVCQFINGKLSDTKLSDAFMKFGNIGNNKKASSKAVADAFE